MKEVAMKEKSQTEDKNKILENIMKISFLLVVSFILCILYFLTYFLFLFFF